jgi:hypothetical protein
MLLRFDLKSEAEAISKEWLLDQQFTKSGQLRLVKLPEAI